jgi:hypothetical protein
MKMKTRSVVASLTACAVFGFANVSGIAAEQLTSQTLTVPIRYEFAGKSQEFHKPTQLTTDTRVTVTRLEYIVSNVAVETQDKATSGGGERYFHLNPLEQDSELQVDSYGGGNVTAIAFDIGVPRSINHGDPARFPAGHPLNVLECNLYWSWQVGYVFLALEGTSQQGSGSKKTFLYHLGNDPLLMHVTVAIPPGTSIENCELVFDLAKVWSGALNPQDGGGLTHSAAGDSLAPRLAENISHAFTVRARAQ